MKRRKLGTLEVSEMGFGFMNASGNYGPAADKNQGIGVIRAAHLNRVRGYRMSMGSLRTWRGQAMQNSRLRLLETSSVMNPLLAP
jgi:hypothetical protein